MIQRPGKIVAIGLNYMDHVRESGAEPPKRPLVFAKFPTSVIGPNEPIKIPRGVTQRVDWEVELAAAVGEQGRHAARAAVIAEQARNVPVDEALRFVQGYTIGNDVSARDLQFADGQWVRAKSLDG